MVKLPPPLVEIIVEIFWDFDKIDSEERKKALIEERSYFAGQFRAVANKAGYKCPIQIQQNLPVEVPIKSYISHQFRKELNTWPCYQIGPGMFTVNVTKDFYGSQWSGFEKTIQTGLELLKEGHPKGLSALPICEINLKYVDAYVLESNESPAEFIKDNLQLPIKAPEGLANNEKLKQDSLFNPSLGFSLKSVQPKGRLGYLVQCGSINGQAGIISHTLVSAKDDDCPNNTVDGLMEWLNSAHDLQSDAFEQLLSKKYYESLDLEKKNDAPIKE